MDLVLFIDMDYFFAACELLRHPEMKNKPVVVGTATLDKKEFGVVQTANYEARKFRIHSAMPTSQAFKLKPDLIYFPDDYKYYEMISGKVMDTIRKCGPKMEIISVDEAAIELKDTDYDQAETIARKVKEEVNSKLNLPCTIGVSTSKTYAKMICDTAKPNGLSVLKQEDIKLFLEKKSVDKLLGVGRKTSEKLKKMGINTIGELSKADPIVLIDELGVFGKELFLVANGIDTSKVIENEETVSISRERSFYGQTKDIKKIEKMLSELTDDVMEEIRMRQLWFKNVSVKVRYADFTEHIKNKKLYSYTDSKDIVYSTGISLIKELVTEKPVRKIGIRVSGFTSKKGQKLLF